MDPGTRVGNLEVIGVIGRGAFGVVYEARDVLLDRVVALKVLPLQSAEADDAERRRALSEARLTGRVSSPHVVTLFGVHTLGEKALAFEMELVRGGSLERRLNEEPPLAHSEAQRIVQHVAHGLHAVHEAGIIHGDVKPGNVLLDESGTAKLADFGLGRPLPDSAMSSTGQVPAGTPGYMAPEVVMGGGPTLASDVWSLGVLMFRVLAGRPPFGFTNAYELFAAIQNADPAQLPAHVPVRLAKLILQCLSKDPVQRPGDLLAIVRAAEEPPRLMAPVAPAPAGARLPAASPLFGRKNERARLLSLLDEACGGGGRAALLAGEAGIGKTTLAHSLADDAQARHCQWVEIAISPLYGLLRPLLDGLRLERSGTSSREPVESRDQMLWSIEHLLEEMTGRAPLVLVIEDAHQAEVEDLRLLAGLAFRLRTTRTLLLVTYRLRGRGEGSSGGADAGGYRELVGREAFEAIALGGLPAESLLELLEHVGGAPVNHEVSREILHSADGNAFFAAEMLRSLLESGAIAVRDHELAPARGWSGRRLPRRVRDLVTRRFAPLTDDQRDLLDVAAVDGYAFDGDAVAAVLDRPLLDVLRALQRLYRDHSLIAPQRTGYTFAHPLVQEVIYDEAAPVLRRTIHRSLAEHLEKRKGKNRVDPERIGTHWERAGEIERAAPFLLEASTAAYERMEIGRVQDLCRRAGWTPERFSAESVPQHPEAALHFAVCLADGGHYDEAARAFDAIREAARAAGDRELELRAVCKRAKSLYHARGVKALPVEQLQEAARELASPQERGLASYCLALEARSRGDIPRTRELLDEADREYTESAWDAGRSDVLDLRATLASLEGDLEEATRLYAEAARLAERAGRRVNAAISVVNSALAAFQRGDFEGIEPRLYHAIAVFDLEGCTPAAHARLVLSHVLLALGRTNESHELVRQARRRSEETGFTVGEIYAGIAEAQLSLMAGDVNAADAALRQALERADATGFQPARLYSLPIRLELLCLRGQGEAAREAFEQRLDDLRKTPPLIRSETLAGVAEVVLFGLDPRPFTAPHLLDDVNETTLRIVVAAQAWCWPEGGADELEAAAAALLGSGIGQRRETRRLVGHRLRAEALRRRGDYDGARAEGTVALERSRALGHAGHAAAADAWLSGLPEFF